MYVQLPDGRELKVMFQHLHFQDRVGRPQSVAWLSGKKGHEIVREMSHLTTCVITDNTTKVLLSSAQARCSISDQFRKRTGVLLSLRKATASLTRDERKAIWDRFHARPGTRAISPNPPAGIASQPGPTV